jgi:ankyrin repeat protein
MKSFFLSVGDPDRKDFLQGYTALHYAAKEDQSIGIQIRDIAGYGISIHTKTYA